MERIYLKKKTKLKSIILAGLESKGYSLVEAATSSRNSIYLYHNVKSSLVAIYASGSSDDELIFLDCSKPDKIKVIINEYQRHGGDDFNDIADILTEIITSGKQKKVKMVNVV